LSESHANISEKEKRLDIFYSTAYSNHCRPMKTLPITPAPAALTPLRVAANVPRYLLAPIAVLALLSVAYGADVSWTGDAGDGSLNTASNWSTGVAPTVNDTVTFGVTNGMLATNRVLLPTSTTYGSVVVDLDTFAIGLGNNPRVLSLGSESISSTFSFTTNFTNPDNNMTFYASNADASLLTLQLRSDLTFSNAGSGTVIFGQKTQIQNSISSTGTDRVIFTGSGDFAFISIAGRSSTITNASTSGASLNLVLDSGFSGTVDYASEVGPTVSSAAINGGTFLLNNASAVMNAGTGVSVGASGTLGGIGTIGSAVVIDSGGTIAPGNSPGMLTLTNGLTWNAGGNYDWEIFNIAGVEGAGWDLIQLQGGPLTFSGLSSSTPFNINIFSLSGIEPDAFGPLAGLAPNSTYSWKILQHNTTITGFDPTYFNLNSNFFVNNVSTGLFTLELGDGDTSLNLVYTTGAAVPESGTWLTAALLTVAAWLRWRHRERFRSRQ
jgi:hypothetical protein